MTIHPGAAGAEKRQVWNEPWYDFIMVQGGHGLHPPSPKLYLDAYARNPPRPVLEAECKYEGISEHRAPDVREVAYRAIQSGAFGYTYGSHGLWYPTQNEDDPMHDKWGKRTPWWRALERSGATQLGYMRTLYESVPWWTLVPAPDAVVPLIQATDVSNAEPLYSLVEHFPEAKAGSPITIELVSNAGGNMCWDHCLFRQPVILRTPADVADPLKKQYTRTPPDPVFTKAAGKDLFFIYFPAGKRMGDRELCGTCENAAYSAVWHDPRTGGKSGEQQLQTTAKGTCVLPAPPDEEDWVLILKRN